MGLGNLGRPTGEFGTVEQTNEDDALDSSIGKQSPKLRRTQVRRCHRRTKMSYRPPENSQIGIGTTAWGEGCAGLVRNDSDGWELAEKIEDGPHGT
jgi:hypothetical protein